MGDTTKITSPESLASWVDEHRNRERLRSREVWLDHLNNLAAFHGRPDIRLGTDFRRAPDTLSARKRADLESVAVNWVQPHVRTLAAHLQRARPIVECEPATTDEADILAAKVGNRLLKGEWRQQEMDARRIEAMMWMAATGNAFWHVYFDGSAGPHLQLPDGQSIPIGLVQTETLNPFRIVVEPNRTSIDKARWCILSQRLPRDEIETKYGESYRELHREELRISSVGARTIASGGADAVVDAYLAVVGLSQTSTADDPDFVDVDLLYHLPTAQYPKGIYAVLAGGKALFIGDYPYAFLGTLPICHMREILSPWRFLGDTSCTAIVRHQEYFVFLREMERRFLRNFSHGKWLLPKGLRIRRKHLADMYTEFVSYDSRGGEKPEFIAGANPPAILARSMETARHEGSRASGLHEASHGIAPQGITAGRAILALQEMDATRLGMTVQLLEAEYARWGRMTLSMVRAYYREERKYHTSGDSLAGAVEQFNAVDLRDTSDVICVPGSAMPQNRLAKTEQVMMYFQAGILGVPQDPETIMRARRMLEFGQFEDIHDDDALDEQLAEKEHQEIAAVAMQIPPGIDPTQLPMPPIPPANAWDNHMVHMKVHLRRWKALMVKRDMLGAGFVTMHMQQHVAALNPAPPPMPEAPVEGSPEAPAEQPAENAAVPTAPPLSEGDQQILLSDLPPRGG